MTVRGNLLVAAVAAVVGSAVLPAQLAAAWSGDIVVTTTIQAAVDSAAPGSTVVIPARSYHESVTITTDGLTLRAEPGALLDGTGLEAADGIRVTALLGERLTGFDLVGLTVQNFSRNGVFLRGVDGYRITGTVTRDDREYGIFPVRTTHGRIDHTRTSGSLDTGLYIGQSTDIELDHNSTFGNTIGIDVEASDRVHVHHNTSARNAIGAVAQVVPGLSRTSTQATVFDHNLFANNNAPNPSTDPTDPLTQLPSGLGLLVVATENTTVENDVVTGNRTAGLAVVQLPSELAALDPRIDPYPSEVHVTDNVIVGNARQPDPKTTLPTGDIVMGHLGQWELLVRQRHRPNLPLAPPQLLIANGDNSNFPARLHRRRVAMTVSAVARDRGDVPAVSPGAGAAGDRRA